MGARSRRASLLVLGLWALGVSSAHGAGARSAESEAAASADTPGKRAFPLVCDSALTVWRKARDPGTRDSCALVVRARASLWSRPAQALREASRAVELAPSSLEAMTALAAATHATGDLEAAQELFALARAGARAGEWGRLPSSLQLLAARVASLSGQRSAALTQYRLVVLDLERIEGPHERARVLLEAAVLAARAEPPSMPEALAYFRQAADHPSPRLASVRFLVGRLLGIEGGEVQAAEVEQAREGLHWMLGGEPSMRGAPGELLPVLAPDLLAEVLPPAPSDAVVEELPEDEAP